VKMGGYFRGVKCNFPPFFFSLNEGKKVIGDITSPLIASLSLLFFLATLHFTNATFY
jgi:hypothetical protein